eukprot:1196377-Prorocentrum_minimum.AAC.7
MHQQMPPQVSSATGPRGDDRHDTAPLMMHQQHLQMMHQQMPPQVSSAMGPRGDDRRRSCGAPGGVPGVTIDDDVALPGGSQG